MICIAGKNDIATDVLSFVVENFGIDGVVALANRDDSGHVTWQHSLIATANRLGVRLISLKEAYELPDLHFFSVEFDRIVIPNKFIKANLYNIHFSLLPAYKGVYTAVWPILNGEITTGVTLHQIEAGIDTGTIIHQRAITIELNDSARDVYYKCLKVGSEVLFQYIPKLIKCPQRGVQQSMVGSTYYGPASINYSALTINLRQTAYQIHNCIRAYSFQEYQLPRLFEYNIRASQITETTSTKKPGELVKDALTHMEISTIDYNLILYKDFSIKLFEAIDTNDVALVLEFVALVPNLEIRNRKGWTPLMIAAYNNNKEIVLALLDAGADINAVNKNGTTVLMYAKTTAAQLNNLEVVKILLQRGADNKAVDIYEKSVIDYAILEGNQEVINYLMNI